MSKKPGGANRQPDLFPRSKTPKIPIEENHRLVLLTDQTDWTELEERAEVIRLSKVKNAAGRPPHMRTNLGAMMLKATRDMTWRELEDQVRHYAPARYLCGLTETDWTPDFTTVHDFAVLLGEDGVKLINEYVVSWAVEEKLADPSVAVADTTAQEAAIPYPNEMGLMAAFVTSVMAASKRAGQVFKKFASTVAKQVKTAGEKLREYRLFAKDKSKAAKDKMVAKMATVIEAINEQLARAIEAAGSTTSRVTKYGVVAREKLTELHQTRGKLGKKVEFGLNWGFARLRGGFLLARLAQNRRELQDTKYAVEAVKDHQALIGKAPRAYAYDRGGYSAKNVAALEEIGVKEVGLAPRGRVQWAVSEPMRKKLVKERALVEAGIGAVKSSRYNFHRPRAKSTRMMGAAGQLAVLGFNLNKLARAFAERRKMVVVG